MSSIITRFAPSPTGILHLGSARTALFNWLYSRHYGGKFLLRLEDTDKIRSTAESVDNILGNLKWLGIHWDGDIVIQSKRQQRHQEIAHHLLDIGQAYRCYCTQKELAEMKEMALAQGLNPTYDRQWRDRTDTLDAPYVIRLKAPLEGEIAFQDTVQGYVKVDCSQLDDMVLLRSDGTPTYMLAVVVDDHDMGVTHIIRGDDHLTNAFRQLNLYNALGWNPPSMSHIPLIHADDGSKLSKRHGAVGVDHYRKQGFLPETVCNGLLRLGWSHGDDEKISQEQAIAWFDGTALSKSAARFDVHKLLALNGHYMRQYSQSAQGLDLLWNAMAHEALDEDALPTEHWKVGKAILPALAQRCTTLCALRAHICPYLEPHLDQTPMLEDAQERENLSAVVPFLAELSVWKGEEIEQSLRAWSETRGIKFGQIAKPLRLVLTGASVSPSLTDVMVALGQEWTLLRIQDSLL